MRKERSVLSGIQRIFLLIMMFFLIFSSGFGQNREVRFFGFVVDSESNPIPGVDILLKDISTSQNYRVKTDKDGRYDLSGLPHGRYQVTVKKDGFETRSLEWDLSAPQDQMARIELETIILNSEERVQTLAKLKELKQATSEVMEMINQNDLEGALGRLRELVAKYPDDSNVHYLLGVTLGRMQRYGEAIPELTRATELAPEFAPAYQQLGFCYQSLKQMDKALESYKKSAELDPANATNLYNLGLILFDMDRMDEALNCLEQSLGIKPDDLDTLEMTARCYVQKEDWPKAIGYLEKARALAQNEEKVKYFEGLISSLKARIKK